jgi:thioesterase domain-containing protein
MPAARHIGVKVESYDGRCLALGAPLAPNVNQMGTAFAGSLNSVATLAGWSLAWLLVHESGLAADVVLQDSSVRYLRPVTRDFTARCCRPEAGAVAALFAAVRRRGRGRIELSAEIREEGRAAVTFAGRYVAHRQRASTHEIAP